jgi:intein/homing endonuclease
VWVDEVDELTGKITNKSRVKYINGFTTDSNRVVYHVDDDTKVVSSVDTLLNMSEIEVGTQLKTVNITNLPDQAEFFTSSLSETENGLTFGTTTVQQLKSQTYDGLFLNIQLEDGTSWSDVPGTNIYVEHSGSNVTSFKRANTLTVGDKILSLANNDNTISSIEITGITVTYENKTIYEVDVEESDLFLTSIGDENSVLKLMIQHNPCYSCNSWNPCGSWGCQSYCPACDVCFIGGTKITTETGYKNIEDIEVGDIVMSYLEGSEILIPRTVIGLLNVEYNGGLVIINGIKTNATVGHPFAVKNEDGELKWASYDNTIDVDYINEGIIVNNLTDEKYSINLNGEWIKIKTIDLEQFKGTVYNIGVEGTHNYFANNILVHNVDKKVAPIF